MILLMQKERLSQDTLEILGWEDMVVPANPDAVPVRGEKPKVADAEELAAVLCAAQVEGKFRIVNEDGSVYQIVIEPKTVYGAEITPLFV